MNRLLNFPLRTSVAPATIAMTVVLTVMACASEKAEFSTPTGKTASSLAPVKPADDGSALSNPFDRAKSQIPAAEGIPAASPQAGPVMDAKTQLRLLDAWDRKKNWMLNADRPQTGSGTEKEADPLAKLQGRRPTALERRMLEDDPAKVRRPASRSEKADYVWNDPASARDRQLKADSGSAGGRFGGQGKEVSADPTGVGSPWESAETERSPGDTETSGLRQNGFRGFRPGSLGESAARMDQVLSGGSALPGLQGGWATLANPGAGPTARIQSLLGGVSDAPVGVSGLFSAQAAEARPAAPPSFLQSSPPVGSSLGAPSAPATATRPARNLMQPQPNVLPFPTREF
jgi:hypothetical protein